MTDSTVPRADLRAGVLECPLCNRRIVNPTDHLHVFGPVEDPTVETADAVECPVCDGVSLLKSRPDDA